MSNRHRPEQGEGDGAPARRPPPAASVIDNTQAAVAMCGSIVCFVTGDAIMKQVLAVMPLGESLVLRGVVSFVAMLVVAQRARVFGAWRLSLSPAVGLRMLADILSTQMFFAGLASMAFADAAAIGQFTPLAVTAGAAIFLGEKVGWRRWLAAAVGLAGVLFIIRPGAGSFKPAGLLILACVLFVVVRDLFTRRIDPAVPTTLITLATVGLAGLSGLPWLLVETWNAPSPATSMLILAAGILNSASYYGAVSAVRRGEVSAIGSLRYLAVPFSLLIGYVVFGEVLDLPSAIGTVIVVSAGLYSLHRERLRAKAGAAGGEAG